MSLSALLYSTMTEMSAPTSGHGLSSHPASGKPAARSPSAIGMSPSAV